MKKYIVGLGCSWTQGEGGYTEEIWKEYNGRVNIRYGPDEHLRQMEHENSWVNVLCRDHFPDHTPVNLGMRGVGNMAAVNNLHFCDVIDWNNSTGIIVLLMSGLERLDFFRETPLNGDKTIPDYYSDGTFAHYKFRTSWPFPGEGGAEEPLWAIYGKMLWSEQFVSCNAMMALLNLQNFAKAHNYKVVVANGFNRHTPSLRHYLKEHTETLCDKFDWPTYLHETTPYLCFAQKFVWLDNLIKPSDWLGHYGHYCSLDWPAEYMTNCVHPTIKGYKVIADEMADFIRMRGYA